MEQKPCYDGLNAKVSNVSLGERIAILNAEMTRAKLEGKTVAELRDRLETLFGGRWIPTAANPENTFEPKVYPSFDQ